MNPTPLKEGQRFVVQGIVYKVIRMRPNGKATIRAKGVYMPSLPKELAPEEKKEEQEFFEEKKGEEDAKDN